ncbi:HAD-IIIC family phosphatase [Streptomyces sp900105245]|uniref:HAD-IIIC family phosphatase n=1 Tax=Streptomyces sp. 900105245 TaxID=3154379 RepID=A0ABV1UJP7_9ACTN
MTTESRVAVKCVVWDLDETLWAGILSEGGAATLRPGAAEILAALDERGVLHSIASRNEPGPAMRHLDRLGIAHYFLHPQISWRPKSESIRTIARALNIGIDALVLVDDSPFERAEVSDALQGLRCIDSAHLSDLLALFDFDGPVTDEARQRRQLYRQAELREAHESDFRGPRQEFLASLDMRLSIGPAASQDLLRAAELTQRTHQLNTTGLTFSAEELEMLRTRPDQTLLTIRLDDRFGSYGVVGLVLLGQSDDEWCIRLFLMSCRVMGRNIGGAVLTYLAQQADDRGLQLTADFLPNEVNRSMYTVYRLAGFAEAGRDGDRLRLQLRSGTKHVFPRYLRLVVDPLVGCPEHPAPGA